MNIGNTNLETRLQCHDPINSNFIYLWSRLHSISHGMRMYKLIYILNYLSTPRRQYMKKDLSSQLLITGLAILISFMYFVLMFFNESC